jgi:folate-binding protein YgfZ
MMPSPSDLLLYHAHLAAGARFGERRGQPVVGSYGDPGGEYAAVREHAAVADLPVRSVLEVCGPSRQSFLQGMLSHEVAGRAPGQGCRAALLTARSAVRALVRALVDDEAVVLETDFDCVGLLQEVLEHHRVAAPVRFAAQPTAVLTLLGPDAPGVLRSAGEELPPEEPEAHRVTRIEECAVRVVRAGDMPGGGFVLHTAPEAAAAVWHTLVSAGARACGLDALDTRRVETLRPWYGSDVTAENLLHETGLVAECHSPTKGCYLGQEVVARLEARRANVNKALRGLWLSAPAAPGTPLRADGKDVGRVTTAAVSPRLGPIALAYVHRGHLAAGTVVEAGGGPATITTSFEDGRAARGVRA